ncbi:MAG: Tm-1-like ATP-binding domain-containing protein, partial [Pseudomonadota bacterium]
VAKCANILGEAITQATAPVRVLIPMGGFSSEDKPGGGIESMALREVFRDTISLHTNAISLDGHINDTATAMAAVDALRDITKD